MKPDPFVVQLAEKFSIPDRSGLADAIAAAEDAFKIGRWWVAGGAWSEQEAAALDALAPQLWKTVELLRETAYPLAKVLSASDEPAQIAKSEDRIRDLCSYLAKIARAAPQSPRRRRGRGQHHPDYDALRALVSVLATFWTKALGREFTQDQAWVKDRGRRLVPVTDAVRFAYDGIEHIAPGEGDCLKTIAREFVDSYRKDHSK